MNERTKHLQERINTYFLDSDTVITLTYRDKGSKTSYQSGEHLHNLMVKARRLCRRKGCHLRYMGITHWGARVHFHVVVNREAAGLVAAVWSAEHGAALVKPLGENRIRAAEWLVETGRICDKVIEGGLPRDKL